MGTALVMQKISIVEKISIVDGWMDGWVDGWVGGWLGGWVDGWVDGWMDGWMDGQIDRQRENFANVTELYSLGKTPKI